MSQEPTVSRLPDERHDAAVEGAIRRAEKAAHDRGYAQGYRDGGDRARTLIYQAKLEAIVETSTVVVQAVSAALSEMKARYRP